MGTVVHFGSGGGGRCSVDAISSQEGEEEPQKKGGGEREDGKGAEPDGRPGFVAESLRIGARRHNQRLDKLHHNLLADMAEFAASSSDLRRGKLRPPRRDPP